MPCSSGRDAASEAYAELEEATVAACAALAVLDEKGIPVPNKAARWWQKHKILDRERQRQEGIEADRRRLRANAKAKLTPEELAALR